MDGLAVVVHRSNIVNGLTRIQIRDIFRGEITNWRQVGGEDLPIRLITREEGSGTREAFVKLVMEAKDKRAATAFTPSSRATC
jgi:phosphate transport system substrate-binding protein